MKEQYEKLRQVIIAANPEIMELKFGCQLEYQNELWSVAKLTVNAILLTHTDGIRVTRFGNYSEAITKYGVKVIGRPIRLADVLLALSALADSKKEKRLANQECPYCYYFSSKLGGAAMTHWECALCDVGETGGSTNTPVLCWGCAKREDRCRSCGDKMFLPKE